MRLGDFEVYRALLLQESGVDINPEKTYLLESRLTPIVSKWGYPTIESMTLALRSVPEPELVHDVVQAMTSNDTWFFRDPGNYVSLRDFVIPYLLKQRKRTKTVRMWSAGCSTGQEIWCMAVTAKDALEAQRHWKFEILATDISTDVLEYAERAIYSQHEAQNETSIRQLIKYFEQSRMGWNVKEELKKCVSFRNSNLLNETEDHGSFDVIYCCNVLNEFSTEARARALDNIAFHLAEDGFLFLGEDETWTDDTGLFIPLPGYPHILILSDGDYKTADFPDGKVSA